MPDSLEIPKTPTRITSTRTAAPKIRSPGVSGPNTPGTRGRKSTKSVADKENSNIPRSSKKGMKHGKPSEAGSQNDLKLRVHTSRDASEIVALLDMAGEMQLIEVVAGEELDETKFRDLMNLKKPIVFRKYASEWKCVKNWAKDDNLMKAAADEAKHLPHRRYRQFVAQSAEEGRLHLTDGKSKAKSVSMEEFLTNAGSSDSTDGLYMLGIHAVGQNSALSYCPVQIHKDDGVNIPPLSRDVPKTFQLIDWYAQLLAERESRSEPIAYDHQQFFLAKGYAFTDLHYDSYDNFYIAVSGTRRWTLACPNASRWLITPGGGKLKSGSTIVPHQKKFPIGSPAQVYPFAVVDLHPGDVIFVPNCWWHLVESIAGDNGYSCAFNYFFSRPADQVFEEFQTSLSSADNKVNSLQAECRANLARAHDSRLRTDIDSAILNAPGGIDQDIWDQLLSITSVHNISDSVKKLHNQLATNSTVKWDHSAKDMGGSRPVPELNVPVRKQRGSSKSRSRRGS